MIFWEPTQKVDIINVSPLDIEGEGEGEKKFKSLNVYQGNSLEFKNTCEHSSYPQTRLTNGVTAQFYRAPELLFGEQYDTLADQWSIGCILAELMKFAAGERMYSKKDTGCLFAVSNKKSRKIKDSNTQAYVDIDAKKLTPEEL